MPQFERQPSFSFCQSAITEILSAHAHKRAIAGIDAGDPSPMVRGYHGQAVSIHAERNGAGVERVQPNAADGRAGGDNDRGSDERRHLHPSTAQHRPITPGCKLRPKCWPDSYQVEAPLETGQTDVVCREADTRAPKSVLARFDDFESLFDRGKIPARAPLTDDPETAFHWIEGHTLAEWKLL